MSKQLRVLSFGTDKYDTRGLQRFFDGGEIGILLVDTANNEEEAIAKFKQHNPDVVVVDACKDPEQKLSVAAELYAMGSGKRPPYILGLHYTEETNLMEDEVSCRFLKMGYSFNRYGHGQGMIEVVGHLKLVKWAILD